MAYGEVLIPPSVRPESPSDFASIDDQTVEFRPAFARGLTQRQTWGDPLWGLKLLYRGLSQAERALLKAAISEARGRGLNVRVSPGIPLRGSFPSTELVTNGTFSGGTTGWSSQSASAAPTLSASDRVLRVKAADHGDAPQAYQQVSGAVQYAPYVARAMVRRGTVLAGGSGFAVNFYDAAQSVNSSYTSTGGMRSIAAVTNATNPQIAAFLSAAGYISAGTFFEIDYISLARCPLVDGSPNGLLHADQFGNAAWSKANATITDNDTTAPDGTATADALVEDTTSGGHGLSQSMAVSSSALELCASFRIKAGTRSWAALTITDAVAHGVTVYVNLSTGALGTPATTGSNVTNARAFSVNEGNGWWGVYLVARKSGSQTTMHASVGAATGDGGGSYSGTTSAKAIYLWRGAMAVSSVPFAPAQTTSAATTGSTQTGGRVNVKGLPVSTAGLLLSGDHIEINGELKRVTASLDSDAAGCGYLQFRPGLASVASDNDPIIVNNPMGRFMIQSVQERESYGLYTDFDLDLIEAPQ